MLRTLRSMRMSSCLAAAMLTTSSLDANSFMRLKMYMSLFSRMPSSVTIVLKMLSTLYIRPRSPTDSASAKRTHTAIG